MLDKNQILQKIKIVSDLAALNKIYKEYLGKNGKVSLTLKNLKDLPKEKRAELGRELNELKSLVEVEVKKRSEELKIAALKRDFEREIIDVTIPGKKIPSGNLHPITKVLRDVQEIFSSMGFEIIEGPEVETEWYNFDALNIPKDHPARDLWDTFWLRGSHQIKNEKLKMKNERLLLRTHTSPVQIRYMETHQPPFRIIAPGRCFRHEATDASHDIQFHQLEGLMVGNDISLANLKGVMEGFMKRFFWEKVKLRWQPSYFPFVEPGLELLIQRDTPAPAPLLAGRYGASNARINTNDTNNKWVEIAGAGMVHPNVFKAVGYNPKDWQGFAFGMGLDRIAMLKYKIDDIRLFYSGDIRFLHQF